MNPYSPTDKRATPNGHAGIPDCGKGRAAKTDFHQAEQKMAKLPGVTSSPVSCPYPACILAAISLQARDTHISSLYQSWRLVSLDKPGDVLKHTGTECGL